MPNPQGDTHPSRKAVKRAIGYMLERTALGLAINLSSSQSYSPAAHDDVPVFSDDVFECFVSDMTDLINHIVDTRPDVVRRVVRGETVTVLSPQPDPPVIRVTSRSDQGGYFNLGELWRWRLLKRLRTYPFKTHQSYGAQWLQERPAGVLADDMGLGKTLQAIAALEGMKSSGRIRNALVLCPKSLIGVWEAEISLWAPRLCTVALYSSVESRAWKSIIGQCHVAVTNYDAIRGDRPEPHAFDLVIFDEVHKLKNPRSLNYSAAYQLNPQYAWGLSGTPLENHAGDVTAILHLLDRKRVSLSDRRLSAPSLRSLAAHYILRRPRAVISAELPSVIEKIELIPLLPEQRRTYDAARSNRGSIGTVGVWISLFNEMRDICDYDPETRKSAKVERATAIVNAIRDLGEKVVVFSWRIEPLRLMQREVARRHGVGSVAMITGQTQSTIRSSVVNTFQTVAEPFVLLCSTRATAEGLTLTAANHVLFLNEWWNPAVNAQARDRVNRIGQRRTVYVYRLRSQDTVESRIDELLVSKAELFDEIIVRLTSGHDVGRQPIGKELRSLVE